VRLLDTFVSLFEVRINGEVLVVGLVVAQLLYRGPSEVRLRTRLSRGLSINRRHDVHLRLHLTVNIDGRLFVHRIALRRP